MATTRESSSKSKSAKQSVSSKSAKQSAQSKARKSSQKSPKKTKKSAQAATSAKSAKSSKSAKSANTSAKSAKSPKAVRLTFSYEGDKVKLLSQQAVEMTVPPSDALGYGGQKGFWAELKSEEDKTLYRHVMHNPTRNDAEVFSPDPAQGITREPAPKRKGVFTVVVPDSGKGHSVRLCRSPVDESEQKALPKSERGVRSLAAAPAEEFARFKLKK
jgi:DNA mismatch repair ATPase MutL